LTLNGSIFDGTDPSSNGFSKSGGGTFVAGALSVNGQLTLNAGTFVLKQNVGTLASKIGSLQITGGIAAPVARLDVTNHNLVVPGGNIATIKSYIQDGENGGGWDGNGITSSIAEADAAINNGQTNLAVGYARGDQLSTYNGSTATFGSEKLGPSDVAIRLTVVGDTNLDGIVDLNSDFSHFVSGYTAPHSFLSYTDWFNGDFNHDGAVDLNKDFTNFAEGFAGQGGSLNGLNNAIDNAGLSSGDKQAMHNIVTTVPEPGIALLGALACVLHFRRRRSN
jgi:hypothetical protein